MWYDDTKKGIEYLIKCEDVHLSTMEEKAFTRWLLFFCFRLDFPVQEIEFSYEKLI